MILISQCLSGDNCRMDGSNNLVPALRELLLAGQAVAVCPECLGGLPVPRAPSERLPDGRVVNCEGEDVTEAFRRGAVRAWEICRANGCKTAVLKARSPSCGRDCIYDGSFTHTRRAGSGVFAELLLANGVEVLTEEEYLAALTAQGSTEP